MERGVQMKGPVARQGQPLWRACEREHGGQTKSRGLEEGGGQSAIILLFVTVPQRLKILPLTPPKVRALSLHFLLVYWDGTDEDIRVGISALCAGEMVGKALRAYPLKFNTFSKGLMSSSQSRCPFHGPSTDHLTPANISC